VDEMGPISLHINELISQIDTIKEPDDKVKVKEYFNSIGIDIDELDKYVSKNRDTIA
jgi:carbamoylphosphate synthase large subunit